MSDKRILDRSAYSTKTIDTFQIVSAYIVDIYYNHLYVEAIKFKNEGKVPSITEGYRHTIYAFLKAMDTKSKTYNVKHYTSMLQGINEYFTMWTSFSTLTIADCINKITQEFVPTDYYQSLDMDQKRNILRTILTQTIKEFSKIIAQEYITAIIDHHDTIDNVNILKDKMIDCMLVQREQMYQQFLDTKLGRVSESIDKNLGVKMQKEIKKLVSEKELMTLEISKLKTQHTTAQDNAKLLLDKYKELLKRYKSIKEEFTTYKTRQIDSKLNDFNNQFNVSVQRSNQLQHTPRQQTQQHTPQQSTQSQPTNQRNTNMNRVQFSKPSVKPIVSDAVKPMVNDAVKPVSDAVKPVINHSLQVESDESSSESSEESSDIEDNKKFTLSTDSFEDPTDNLLNYNSNIMDDIDNPKKSNKKQKEELQEEELEKQKEENFTKLSGRVNNNQNVKKISIGKAPNIADIY